MNISTYKPVISEPHTCSGLTPPRSYRGMPTEIGRKREASASGIRKNNPVVEPELSILWMGAIARPREPRAAIQAAVRQRTWRVRARLRRCPQTRQYRQLSAFCSTGGSSARRRRRRAVDATVTSCGHRGANQATPRRCAQSMPTATRNARTPRRDRRRQPAPADRNLAACAFPPASHAAAQSRFCPYAERV